jgi:predicted RNA-binding protein YlxR (DUF448 family)
MTRTSNSSPIVARPVPMRTCVGCRSVKPKRELVRLVRNRRGFVEIDTAGKKEGRGAYICPDITCWEKALKGQQLERTLKSALTPENRAELIISGREMVQGVD